MAAPKKSAPKKMKALKQELRSVSRRGGRGPAKPTRSSAKGSIPQVEFPMRRRYSRPGRTGVVNASTGFQTGTRKLTKADASKGFTKTYRAAPKPRGGVNIPKFLGEVGDNLSKVIPSRGASGIVPKTMKGLPKGGVSGYLKNRSR